MADVSRKLEQVRKMVENEDYFIINRPRQYGKTTTFYTLEEMLEKTGKYIVFNISFEGIGDDIFTEETRFSKGFVQLMSRYTQRSEAVIKAWLASVAAQTQSLKDVSEVISELILKTYKKAPKQYEYKKENRTTLLPLTSKKIKSAKTIISKIVK